MPGREGALISVPCLTISLSHTLCQGLIGVVKGRLAFPLLNLTWLVVGEVGDPPEYLHA